jgi:hypothetical protein
VFKELGDATAGVVVHFAEIAALERPVRITGAEIYEQVSTWLHGR